MYGGIPTSREDGGIEGVGGTKIFFGCFREKLSKEVFAPLQENFERGARNVQLIFYRYKTQTPKGP